MIDDDGRRAALGLGAFAGIVDDEGVKMRQRPEGGFRITGGAHRQGLAGQPFQVAVFAHVDDTVGAEVFAQPGIKGQVAVGRHQVRVVIGGLRINVVAARRLQADDDIAAAEGRHGEAAAIDLAAEVERIGLRRTPALQHRFLDGLWKSSEETLIVVHRQAFPDVPGFKRPDIVGRPGLHPAHEIVAGIGQILGPVTGLGQGLQNRDCPRRGIEANAIAEPSVPVGIVGQHQGDLALGDGGAPEPGPVGGQGADKIDAVGNRLIADDIGLGFIIAPGPALKGDGARQNPPVDLRQGHVHGNVPRPQAKGTVPPGVFVAAGKDHLQDRTAGPVEGR